jgi:anti-anti-sigma factor
MATTPSVYLSLAAGRDPGNVTITIHGALGVLDAARLQRVLDDVLNDGDAVAISVDLYDVRGDVSGILSLAAAAERCQQRGVELTLCHPSPLLCPTLESAGLTTLIRMVQKDRRPPWSVAGTAHGRQDHPSAQMAQMALVTGPDQDTAHQG